jgi:two-component system chemotaxis response regulator CheY
MPNRVLIVDDALIIRMKIRNVATSAGWEVVGEAANGQDAVALYREISPDLVTMDMIMPKMDGLAALRAIRSVNSDARVVMVSAVDQKEKLRECIESGATDFIVKPFDESRLKMFFEKQWQSEESN